MEESVFQISKKLEEIGFSGIFDAYKMLRSRAFKSDLWRLLILWDQGGVYIDNKLVFADNLDWINWDNDELILCGNDNHKFDQYWNGLIISAQYHPALLVAAMESVKKILERYHEDMYGLAGSAHLTDILKKNDIYLPNR